MNTQADPTIEQNDRELFNRIAMSYAKKDQVQSSSIARKYQLESGVGRLVKGRTDVGRIVEIACGIGASASYLKGRYSDYVGIDHSDEMIEIAKWFNEGNSTARFLRANAKERVDTGGPADLVLAVGALHHMTELDDLFDTMKGYAAPGAQFVAIEPYRGNPFVQLLRYIRSIFDRGYSTDQSFFSKKDLRELLERNEMLEIELVNQGFFSPPFAQVILPPQFITILLSRLTVALDKFCDRLLVPIIGPLSWNIVVRAKFPPTEMEK